MLETGADVVYEDRLTGAVLEAVVVSVHHDDDIPYYTIVIAAAPVAIYRNTIRARLRRRAV